MAYPSIAETVDAGWLPARERPRPVRALLWLLSFARKKPLGFLGMIIVLSLVATALLADAIAPYPPDKIDLRNSLEGPSREHLLGTDRNGKDTLSRLIHGARISMYVGFGAVALGSTGAALLGITSAYLGGWGDKLIQRFVDAWQAMPGLIILITLLGIARRMPDIDMVLAMVVAIGILIIAGQSRVIRSAALATMATPYVEAARALGAGGPRIIFVHVLPNVLPLVLVTATISLGGVILAEASLSFLGFGPDGEPSWGQMLSLDGREYMSKQPGLAIFPGLAIGLAVFGFNMFGDALRDVLDPRLRGRR
ncbi:MAG TPA: ABC transporter permease [Dehalococcoidia bacterium]